MFSHILILILGISYLIIIVSSQDEEHDVKHKWTSLRVTLSSDPEWAYQKIPNDWWEADKQGWRATSENCTNNGAFNGYRFIPKIYDGIGALYDINGILSGFQMMPKRSNIMIPENGYQFDSQPAYQNGSVLGIDVLVLTAYFVHPSTICTTGRTDDDLNVNGIGNGLWFQKGSTVNDLITIQNNKNDAREEGWRDNTCLPMMGHHSFFESETWDDNQCADFFPAWVFYDLNEKVSGFGFFMSGYDDSPRYQHVQGVLIQHILGSYSSECMGDLADTIGLTLINAYFDDAPEEIVCEIKYDESEQIER